MNKKLTAFIIAVFLLLSCGFSAFALSGVSIGDVLSIIASVDTSKYTSFSEQEWSTLSSAERAEQINFVISDQKGKSYITESSDFINDSSLSYEYYNLITNNSSMTYGIPGVTTTGNILSKQYLEQNGLANFGMGYYDISGSPGHSSGGFGGKFGDGTVADTLNGEFIGYMQDNPLPENNETCFLTDNGYTIIFYAHNYPEKYWPYERYHLECKIYNPYGELVVDRSLSYYGYYADNDGNPQKIYDWMSRMTVDYNIVTMYREDGTINERYSLDPYVPNKDGGSSTPVSNDPLATGVDENGNKIQFNINSDGVTYEGSTYNYNDDNSVTINGNTYYITVDPSTIDPDYYNKFLGDTINNYYNYYTTDGKEFDPTDIISSLKSIFSSLEAFRSYCYNQLKQIYNTVHDGFNSLRSSISSWGNKIVISINSLGGSSDLTDEQLFNYQEQLENAVNSRFGVVISLRDLVDKALSAYKSSTTSQINFKFKGFSYSIDFSTWFNDDNLKTIRFLMAAFIYVSYAFNTFRRVPSYIYNGGDR